MGNEESQDGDARAGTSAPNSVAAPEVKVPDPPLLDENVGDSSSSQSNSDLPDIHVKGDGEEEPSLKDESLVPHLKEEDNSEEKKDANDSDEIYEQNIGPRPGSNNDASKSSDMDEMWSFLVQSESEEKIEQQNMEGENKKSSDADEVDTKNPAAKSPLVKADTVHSDLGEEESSTLDKTLLREDIQNMEERERKESDPDEVDTKNPPPASPLVKTNTCDSDSAEVESNGIDKTVLREEGQNMKEGENKESDPDAVDIKSSTIDKTQLREEDKNIHDSENIKSDSDEKNSKSSAPNPPLVKSNTVHSDFAEEGSSTMDKTLLRNLGLGLDFGMGEMEDNRSMQKKVVDESGTVDLLHDLDDKSTNDKSEKPASAPLHETPRKEQEPTPKDESDLQKCFGEEEHTLTQSSLQQEPRPTLNGHGVVEKLDLDEKRAFTKEATKREEHNSLGLGDEKEVSGVQGATEVPDYASSDDSKSEAVVLALSERGSKEELNPMERPFNRLQSADPDNPARVQTYDVDRNADDIPKNPIIGGREETQNIDVAANSAREDTSPSIISDRQGGIHGEVKALGLAEGEARQNAEGNDQQVVDSHTDVTVHHCNLNSTDTSKHEQSLATSIPAAEEDMAWVDPVLAAAQTGAAVKRAREEAASRSSRRKPIWSGFGGARRRTSLWNSNDSNEWKRSLKRFAKSAASTASTVAHVAVPIIKEATTKVTKSASEIADSYHTSMQEQGEHDAQQIVEIDDVTMGSEENDKSDTEEEMTEKYGGFGYQLPVVQQPSVREGDTPDDMCSEEVNYLIKDSENEAGTTVSQVDLKSGITRTPLRKHRPAPIEVAPAAAFSGAYGSDYAGEVPGTPKADSTVSPGLNKILLRMSPTFLSPDSKASAQSYDLHQIPFCDGDGSSIASSHTPSSARRTLNRESNHNLSTPKQLVELVSKKLSSQEDLNAAAQRWSVGRQSGNTSRNSSIAPSPRIHGWIHPPNRRSFVFEESIFAEQRKPESPTSLSPPNSPLSTRPSTPSRRASEPAPPPDETVVTLWDMIPTEKPTPAPEQRDTVFFEPGPKAFLGSPIKKVGSQHDFKSYASCSSECGSRPWSTGLLRKRKNMLDCDSSSIATDPGKMKKRRSGKRRPSFSTRSGHNSVCSSLQNSAHSERRSLALKQVLNDTAHPDLSVRRMSDEYEEEHCDDVHPFLRNGSFEEALFSFSSLTELDFLSDITFKPIPDSLQFLGSVRWRQLMAYWKHSEIMNDMTLRPCSHHFVNQHGVSEWKDGSTKSSSSTRSVNGSSQSSLRSRRSVLSIESSEKERSPGTANLSGFSPHLSETELPILSTYLTSIGPLPPPHWNEKSTPELTRISAWDSHGGSFIAQDDSPPLIDDLHARAENNLALFSSEMERIAHFASLNCELSNGSDSGNHTSISYSVGIKSLSAISDKANRKYGGDVMQVKDILRAQFVFPDEGSLVCAISSVNQICYESQRENNAYSRKGARIRMEIVRIKNLFRLSPLGTVVASNLPTGYRHVLVNVRLNGEILAEIQLQLSHMFNILGQKGYALHRDIVEADAACMGLKRNKGSDIGSSRYCLRQYKNPDQTPERLIDHLVDIHERQSVTGGQSDVGSSARGVAKSSVDKTNGSDRVDPTSSAAEPAHGESGITASPAAAAAAARSSAISSIAGTSTRGHSGGIGASAAAAARSSMVVGLKGIGRPGGGVAAAAAAAAASRGLNINTSEPPIPEKPVLGGGSIAVAAAAAAAAARSSSAGNSSGGGVAAAAAAAARGKPQTPGISSLGGGGIAAVAAAAAAAARSPATTSMGGKDSSSGGNAAAVAAAAHGQTDNGDEPPTPRAPGLEEGSIAARSSSASRYSGGGIAAAAAAEARGRTRNSDKPQNSGLPALGGGGIAAAAAAAAAARSSAVSSLVGKDSSRGGIASAAAAAARGLTHNGEKPPTQTAHCLGQGSIAAAAAAAASARSSSSRKNSGGGIAAAAAAAARGRNESSDKPRKPGLPPPGGGIAVAEAAVAAVAAARSPAVSRLSGEGFSSGGGIAAAAAAAARGRTSNGDEPPTPVAPAAARSSSEGSNSGGAAARGRTENSDKSQTPGLPPIGGGIAAAAAAAAAARSSVLNGLNVGGSPGSGIAAAAAAAARGRTESTSELPKLLVPALTKGGIAAAAAAAAAARSREADSSNDVSPDIARIRGGGDGSSPPDDQNVDPLPTPIEEKEDVHGHLPVGGIAAAAAAAAQRRRLKPEKDSAASQGLGGIAAAAAAAAALRATGNVEGSLSGRGRNRENISEADFIPNPAVGEAPAAKAPSKISEEVPTQPNEGKKDSPMSGIALAAATAASSRFRGLNHSEISSSPSLEGVVSATSTLPSQTERKSPAVGVSVAAAAAAAAQKRDIDVTKGSMLDVAFGGGGIAAAAAAAARSKQQAVEIKKASSSQVDPFQQGAPSNNELTPKADNNAAQIVPNALAAPRPGPNLGGIASAATSAATLGSDESNGATNTGGRPPRPPAAGVAAAAASAAKKRDVNLLNISKPISKSGGKGSAKDGDKHSRETTSRSPTDSSTTKTGYVRSTKDETESHNFKMYSKLANDVVQYSVDDVLNAIIQIAAKEALQNPRDVAACYGIYFLSMCRASRAKTKIDTQASQKEESSGYHSFDDLAHNGDNESPSLRIEADLKRAEMALLRCLVIANQATSVGMMGWLEYGSSNLLERTTERPYDILSRLACLYVLRGDWNKAVDVLRSLVLRCEQHLPLYHPMTLSAMLDLSAALNMISEVDQACRIAERTSQRLALYLAEQEESFLSCRKRFSSGCRTDSVTFRDQTGIKHVSTMRAFVSILHRLLKREFADMIGRDNEMVLLNHCFVGDALSVLANCLEVIEGDSEQQRSTPAENAKSEYDWNAAYQHYRLALKGWTKGRSLDHPNVTTTSCAVARCLRQLGKGQAAINLLSTVLASKSQGESDESLPMVSFMPSTKDRGSSSAIMVCSGREQSAALCLWSMAVFFAENNPDERGRIRALSLLHASSETLQSALKKQESTDEYKEACLDMLHLVENEARELFEPLQSVADNMKMTGTRKKKNNVAESTTTGQRERRRKPRQMATRDDCYDHPVAV